MNGLQNRFFGQMKRKHSQHQEERIFNEADQACSSENRTVKEFTSSRIIPETFRFRLFNHQKTGRTATALPVTEQQRNFSVQIVLITEDSSSSPSEDLSAFLEGTGVFFTFSMAFSTAMITLSSPVFWLDRSLYSFSLAS